jgi:hypothetical protein
MIPNAPIYKGIKNYNDGDNKDLRKQIMDVTPEAVAQMRGSAKYFKGKDNRETCYKIWKFLKTNIRYEADGEYQIVRLPSALLATKVGDCKSFSVFTSAVLTNLGIPNHYVMTSYGKDPTPSHIYVVTDSGIICDAVWTTFNAEKSPTYRYKAKPNNMNNKGLGGGCTAMGATSSVPRFKVGMNGSAVPYFRAGMNGNCGCAKCKGMGRCNCGCGMGYPGGQGMGAANKYTLSVPRQVILGIFSLNVGGLATLIQNKGNMSEVESNWKKIGGDVAAVRTAIRDGASKPARVKWFGQGIKNRIVASINEGINKRRGIGASEVEPTTEQEFIKDGETAKTTPYSVSVGDVTAIAFSDSTKDEKNKQYIKLGLAGVSATLCSGDPTQVVKLLCSALGYISGDLLTSLYDIIKKAFAKDIADESQANAAAELASQQAVVDLVNSYASKIGTEVVESKVTRTSGNSNVFGGGGQKVETIKYKYTKEMAEAVLTDLYYKASASSKPYMVESLKANNLCKNITANIGGGGAKLASGGIIMAGVALGALFLLSGAKKGGKGRKL